jgi:hypothetical protein
MTVNEILLAILKLASVPLLLVLPGLQGAGQHHSQMEHAA